MQATMVNLIVQHIHNPVISEPQLEAEIVTYNYVKVRWIGGFSVSLMLVNSMECNYTFGPSCQRIIIIFGVDLWYLEVI